MSLSKPVVVQDLKTINLIKRFIIKHGDKYGYDQVIYIDCKTNVTIYCYICKKYFSQCIYRHLKGNGCCVCYSKKKIPPLAKSLYVKFNKLVIEEWDYEE